MLPDASNTSQHTAQFSPLGLDRYAPGVFEDKDQERLTEVAKKIQHERLSGAMAEFKKQSPLMTRGVPAFVLTKIFETIAGEPDPSKIVDLLKQHIQKDTTQEKMVDAEVVSVDDHSGQIEKGNIDLPTRPRVKNNRKISTVAVELKDGTYVLLPAVSDDGKMLSTNGAKLLHEKTGKHLGVFKTKKQADEFAVKLHESEARRIQKENN